MSNRISLEIPESNLLPTPPVDRVLGLVDQTVMLQKKVNAVATPLFESSSSFHDQTGMISFENLFDSNYLQSPPLPPLNAIDISCNPPSSPYLIEGSYTAPH